MRNLLIAVAATLSITACATQNTQPAPVTAAPEATAAKAPQCWNGDLAKFEAVGTKATVSGIPVVCEKTSDGKAGQWTGKKH